MKYKIIIIAFSFLFYVSSAFAACETLDCNMYALINEIKGLPNLMESLSYLFGVFFGFKTALKLKEFNESKGQKTSLSSVLWCFFACACFMALPTYIGVGIHTLSLEAPTNMNY